MTNQTAEKIYKEIASLRKETNLLKNIVLKLLKDQEGEYKDKFVEKVIKSSQLKPKVVFVNKADFLKQLSAV